MILNVSAKIPSNSGLINRPQLTNLQKPLINFWSEHFLGRHFEKLSKSAVDCGLRKKARPLQRDVDYSLVM